MNNNDNPVPSLDKKEINFIIKCLEYKINFGIVPSYKKRWIRKIILKLQNGVETNKEQPEEYTVSGKKRSFLG